MEILAVIGLIVIVLIIFTGGGILGLLLKGVGEIFNLLAEGWSNIFGCLFWIFIVFFLLLAIAL